MPTTEVTTLSHGSIAEFRDWLCARGKSPQTVKAYIGDLTTLLRETEEDSISQEEFTSTAMYWLNGNRSTKARKTTTRRLTSLKVFARWAGWGEPLADYNAPKTVPGVPHPIPEGMEGVRRMIAAARSSQHKALVALCGMAGLRVAEALEVRPSDIDRQDMVLRVLGKGEKYRFIPVNDELWDIIAPSVVEAFLANDAQLVGLHDRAARKVVTRLAKSAGLQRHVSSHDLRATFATEVYNKTLDIRVVQELLGHSSVETTQIYTGVRLNALRDAVRQI